MSSMNTYGWRTGVLSFVGSIALSLCFFSSGALAQEVNATCAEINDLHSERYVYSLPYEDSAWMVRKNDGTCEVTQTGNSLSSACVSYGEPNITVNELNSALKVALQHTHPLETFANPAFPNRLTQSERQAVCDGNRIPPSAQPSGADWLMPFKVKAQSGENNSKFEYKVYDPGGVWTFYIANPDHRAVKAIDDMLAGTSLAEATQNLSEDEIIALNDVVLDGGSQRPTSDDPVQRDARIKELEDSASLIGLYLRYQKNKYSEGGIVISDANDSDGNPIPLCPNVPADADLFFGDPGSGSGCSVAPFLTGNNTDDPSPDDGSDPLPGDDDTPPGEESDDDTSTGGGIFSNLVPCGINTKVTPGSGGGYTYEDECTICHLQVLAQNVLRFIVAISIAVAALMFANAGFLYVSSPGNAGNISRAHHLFTNTLMGIIIILVAFLLIDTILKMTLPNTDGVGSVYKSEGVYGPWNKILCGVGGPRGSYDVEGIDPVITTVTPATPTYQRPATCDVYGGTCIGAIVNLGCPPSMNPDRRYTCLSGGICCVPAFSGSACKTPDGESGYCLPGAQCARGTASVGSVLGQHCGSSGNLICCAEREGDPQITPPITRPPPTSCDCTDEDCLIAKYKGIKARNYEGLNELISCYRNDQKVDNLLDKSQIYTYERTNPVCNWTNGERVCGTCAHSRGSSHYGAGTGLGSLAVDFNASPPSKEKELCAALKARRPACEQFTRTIICQSAGHYGHSHISHKDSPKN